MEGGPSHPRQSCAVLPRDLNLSNQLSKAAGSCRADWAKISRRSQSSRANVQEKWKRMNRFLQNGSKW